MTERGQITIPAVALMLLLVLGGVFFGRLTGIGHAGAVGQRSADMAVLAAAKALAADPAATAKALQTAARRSAEANGAELVSAEPLAEAGVVNAVQVTVRVPTPDGPVVARARAGVTFSATLDPTRFRPVDLHGLAGRSAVVAAAAAQIGWPYVWGGESRAEGGFDCSGLIGYAFSAAGAPLPGRPTADSLWRMSQPIAAAQLQPGDLVFAGTSGTAYHVGLYAGDGMVLSAPRTGEVVGYSPLAYGSWDGFGRLLPPGAGPATRDTGVERAARRHGVPWHVIDAEMRLGLVDDPEAAAAALAGAQQRHPGSLEAALADQLGSEPAAALVIRAGSGPGLGDGFGAEVRLMPIGSANEGTVTAAGPPLGGGVARSQPSPRRPASPSLLDHLGTALHAGESVATQLAERGRAVPLQATAAVRTGLRLGMTGMSAFLPDPDWADAVGLAGSVWDAGAAVADLAAARATGGMALGGWGLWAARFSLLGGALSTGLFGWKAFTARRRRDQLGYGMMAAGSAAATAGLATGGVALMTLGAGAAVIPPVGLALVAVGAGLCVGGYLVRHPEWVRAGLSAGGRMLDVAWRVQTAPARAAASLAGAAIDRGKSLLDSVPTPW